MPLKEDQEICSIEYLSPEQVPDTILGKNSIVDVKCLDNHGRSFIVEMQSEWSSVFRKRLLVNGSKAVIRQLERENLTDKAKKFQEMKPVYVLAVVNGTFSKGKEWYHHLQIMDAKNPDVVIEGLDYVLLELPNFTQDRWRDTHKEIALLWLRFLKEIDGYYDTLPEELVSNEIIYNAIKICEVTALSLVEREAYEHSQDVARWQDSIQGLEDEVLEARRSLAEKNKSLAEKDKSLAERDKSIEENKKTIDENKKTIDENKKTIDENKKMIAQKDREIEELKRALKR